MAAMFDLIHNLYHNTLELLVDHPVRSAVIGVPLAGILVVGIIRHRRKGSKRVPLLDYKDGVAYLHMFNRNFTKKVVNLSPYAIKVETWCRMNKVPYEVVETSRMSSKTGQIPYLILDGEETVDSSVMISRLGAYFKVASPPLTEHQQGVQRAVTRMMDDVFAVLYFWQRYFLREEEFKKYFCVTTAPRFIRNRISHGIGKTLSKRAYHMGFGRVGEEKCVQLGQDDLLALENILGDGEYFFGDRPSETDAVVFAHLTQILCPDLDYPWKSFIRDRCPRLLRHFERVLGEFWPDWDDLVSTGTFE